MLVSGSRDKSIKIWDIDTSALLAIFKGQNNPTCFTFSPNSTFLFSGYDAG